jgi:hypothetical protein
VSKERETCGPALHALRDCSLLEVPFIQREHEIMGDDSNASLQYDACHALPRTFMKLLHAGMRRIEVRRGSDAPNASTRRGSLMISATASCAVPHATQTSAFYAVKTSVKKSTDTLRRGTILAITRYCCCHYSASFWDSFAAFVLIVFREVLFACCVTVRYDFYHAGC